VRQIFPFSSIRTLTVGFGIAPNLLTPPTARRALAGFGDRSPFTAGGDFHPAPRTRSDRNPTNAINAPLAKPCNDFRELLDHAEPTERFSTANDYYPTACDSCRGGTWVRTKLGRVLMRSHHGRSPASASSRRWPSGANRKTANIGAACRSAKLMDLPTSQGASSINPEITARQTSACGKEAAIRCSSGAAPLVVRETRST
jgi:hypothetical protein